MKILNQFLIRQVEAHKESVEISIFEISSYRVLRSLCT